MKVRALHVAAICLALSASASVAEPVPFTRLIDIAQQSPDTIFLDPFGVYFVLDLDQNLAWIVDRDGKFEHLTSLTIADGFIDVALDGELIAHFSLQEKVEWQSLPDVVPALPASRSVFQKLMSDAKLTKAVGKFLSAGSQFDGYFSINTPEGATYLWRPEGTAQGILIRDLTTGAEDFVDIPTLSAALAGKE